MRHIQRLALALLLAAAAASPARANLILAVEGVTSEAGQSGTFLVTLSNTGTAAIDLSAYQIQLETDAAWLTFTGVSRSTSGAGYVFPGATDALSSDFGSGPVALFTALDLSAALSGFDTLAAGATYGVLNVAFAVDMLAPAGGIAAIRFVSPGSSDTDLTQLAGPDGLLAFQAVDGLVTLQAIQAVPEPSSLPLAVLGLALLSFRRARTRPPVATWRRISSRVWNGGFLSPLGQRNPA